MTYPGFVPFTGFDPLDGEDDRFTLSRSNPCRVQPADYRSCRDGERLGGLRVYQHGEAN